MGAVVNLLRRVLSPVKSALLGAAVAAALAACWPFLFPFPTTTWVEIRTFLLWQGAPSLISIVAGAVGWLLPVTFTSENARSVQLPPAFEGIILKPLSAQGSGTPQCPKTIPSHSWRVRPLVHDARTIARNEKQSQRWLHPDDAVPLGAVPFL